MPDFGLTEALEAALKATKGVEMMRPAERELAGQALPTVAPTLPEGAVAASSAPVARVPSAPSAVMPPDAVQAPALNPSQPPADLPPGAASEASAAPNAAVAPPPVATGAADGAPPIGALAASETPPQSPQPTPVPGEIAPGNRVLPLSQQPTQVPLLSPVQQAAQKYVKANIGDFADKLDMTHMPNVDVMASPDQLKAAILQVADDNKGAIEAARGGTVTDQQLIGLAQDLSVNQDQLKQVMTSEFGDPVKNPAIVLAARMVEQQQMGTLMALSDRVLSGQATAEEIARFEQQAQVVEQYRTQIAGLAAGSGRTQRAFGIPVGLPNDVMDHVAQIIRQNNPDMKTMAQAIKLASTPEGIANIVHGNFWYRALVKAPFNLLQRVFINGILSGPSFLRIVVGNNFNLASNIADLYSAGIGRGMYGLATHLGRFPTAEEGVTLSDAYAHLQGVISGGADALRVAGRVLRTGQSLDNAARAAEDFGKNKIASGPNAILPELRDSYFGSLARGLGRVIDFPGTVIGSIDAFTQTLGFRGYKTMMVMRELRARANAGTLRPGDVEALGLQMVQNADPSIDQAAEEWAHRMTFQTPWPEGGPGEKFQGFLSAAPVFRFIFPFMRTATNIFKQSMVERGPLTVFSARVVNQLRAGGFEGDLAKARIAQGTAIGSMVAWMAIHDRITGPAPKDAKERAIWSLDGRTPYSIRISDPITGKDSWHSYQWFEPMATIAGVVADAISTHAYIASHPDTMMDHEEKMQDIYSNIIASIIQNTGDKTFMQNATAFAEMYDDPKRAFGMWASTMGATAVPFSGLLKETRNLQDPYLRQAFTLLDKVKDELPTVPGVVPGSRTLVARQDIFGQSRTTSSGNAVLGPLNPLPDSPSKKDDLTDEIQNVMAQTHTVPLSMPSARLSIGGNGRGLEGGQGMRLTPQEYEDYVTKSRSDPIFDGGTRTFRDKLEAEIAKPGYQTATPAERHDRLQAIQNSADKIGADRLWRENDDFRERMTQWEAEKNRLKFNQ